MCPKEYERCRDAKIAKGTPSKDAKRDCAIAYYKRHGVPVNKAHKGKK